LKQFDQDEPRFPQRPFLTGRRDDLASYLKWAPPDCGGSPISYFKIYRGTVPGSEKYIGKTSGDDFDFVDRHTDPSVVAYTYKVTAVTAVGEGLPSNIISLEVTSRPDITAACSLPGQTVITDGIGDASDTLQQHDISSVSMAEPDSLAGNVVFTIKMVNLSTIPPGWRWSVRFLVPGYDPPANAAGAVEDWFVSMTSADGASPTFTYGTTGVPSPGGQSTARFFTTIGNLDPASNAQADGTITLVLPKEAIRSSAVCKGTCGPLNAGQTINLTLGSVRATAPSTVPSAGGTNETIPDTTGPASYTLRPANLCFANTEPIARMTSDVDRGDAPFTVQFDGSSSHDPDSIDTIASYTFNFGDGGDDVTQASPVIVHTFTQAGEYDVRMVVTDSRGKTSLNTAHALVEAESGATPPPTPTPTPTATPAATPTPTPTGTPTATPTPTPGQGSTTVQFASNKYTVTEGCTQAMISVVRTGATGASTTVRYVINDATASQRSDFTYAAGTLTFGPGETMKAFPVLITDDAYSEGVETATIVLSAMRGGSAGSPMTATLEIVDNDNSDLPLNPIDDSSNFVGEHYHDFLNRQADTDGQSFWTNNIDSCGTDAACIETKRVNVSAAFYLSIEFQQTGYLVERIYKTAFGDAPGTSTLGGSHNISAPIVRFDEFLADTQAIGNGVVVLQNGWEQKLEQNKQTFAADFVTRDRFTSAYPATLGAADFVDRLNANAGNPLSQSERDQLVNELAAGAKTRAEVLRAVAEDNDLAKAEFNRAFVLMQYFGYLRRNPNSAPDSDYTGYEFWLSKLNDFNGDFVKAEMVKAFIGSTEYRERFQGGTARGNPAGAGQASSLRQGITRSLWVSLTPTLLRTFAGGS
jgi:PKD repeat protein